MDKKETALHEAGHAVAHVRLEIQQGFLSIIPSGNNAGSSLAEGADHVWSKKDAERQVIAYCAGYAALVAHGYDNEEAQAGAWGDFDTAVELIEQWELGGTLAEWQKRTVRMMSKPENIRAVKRLADELLQCEKLDGDTVDVLVEVADGNITKEEYKRFKVMRDSI